jgi:hypothetical protein
MQNSLKTLDLVEQKFNEVASFLVSGDAVSMEVATLALRDLALELSRLLPIAARTARTGKVYRLRLKKLAGGVQILRENLSRRAAFVDQAVRVLVPTSAPATYSSGGSVYGTAIHQSGAFKVLAA